LFLNTATPIKRKQRPPAQPIALTRAELRALLQHASGADPEVYLLMLIQYWHAGRNSEMISLRRESFSDGFIRYKRGKGSEACTQELVEHADPLFNERAVVSRVVLNLRPNQKLYPRSRWTYWRHLVKLALAAGIPRHKAKTTVLKHTICTHLSENLKPNAVQRRAGHVNGANTLKYARLREDQVDALVVAGAAL
jgi:integrase